MANTDPGPSKFLTDWSKCCLCQKKKSEEPKSPCVQQPQEHDGYTKIVTNISFFHAINEMPIVLDPARLDDSGGLEETLEEEQGTVSPKLLPYVQQHETGESQKKKRGECSASGIPDQAA